jgi:hypothetical protein
MFENVSGLDATHLISAAAALLALVIGGVVKKYLPSIIAAIWQSMNVSKLAGAASVVCLLSLVGFGGNRWHQYNRFDAQYSDNLVAAYNADNSEMSQRYMDRAKVWVDTHFDKGTPHTSVIYPVPSENMHDWYERFQKSQESIAALNPVAEPTVATVAIPEGTESLPMPKESRPDSKLVASTDPNAGIGKDEKTKLPEKDAYPWRTKLVKDGLIKVDTPKDKPVEVTAISPRGASLYPFNFYHALWAVLSGLGFVGLGVVSMVFERK